MDLGISGLASGLDWKTLIDQLIQAERAPEQTMLDNQNKLEQRNNAYGSLLTQVNILKARVTNLADPTLFDSRTSSVDDSTVATASVASGAAQGTYTFHFNQKAVAAVEVGHSDVGAKLSATDDVSGLTLANAGFPTAVTAGTFTVNGQIITIATSDTLQSVFDKINTVTGGTAGYSAATDEISLHSGSEIVLGSATDTSNFLKLAKLYNNGGPDITSTTSLGGVRLTGTLSAANFSTAVSDGGSGAGLFKINGVSISFNATTDTVASVLQRINNSDAGVTAGYDVANDRFVLTNKETGDVGMALQDVTGNFLAASGLTTGSLQRGKNCLYTIDDGGVLTSQSNTITDESSGVTGLSVTAIQEGESATISVNADKTKITSAITDFIGEYNKLQSMIDTQSASTTDASGVVTAGILEGEGEANELAGTWRSLVTALGSGSSISSLDDLGIVSNGSDNSVALSDSSKLDDALTDHLADVKALFTNTTNGLAVGWSNYVTSITGDNGLIPLKQTSLTKQASDITDNIAALEKTLTSERQRLTDSFTAMETARQTTNQQASFLTQHFGSS